MSATKDEAVKALRDAGFDSVNKNGVVETMLDLPVDDETELKIREILDSIGYNASFGFTYHKRREEDNSAI